LQCSEEQLVDALTGRAQPVHGEMLALQLQRLQLIDQQIYPLKECNPDWTKETTDVYTYTMATRGP
jgi:hypothetical protein